MCRDIEIEHCVLNFPSQTLTKERRELLITSIFVKQRQKK